MSPTDGGPAFPGAHPVYLVDPSGKEPTQTIHKPHGGMSLRDYFAAKAMQGLYASGFHTLRDGTIDKAVVCAYAVADAMLKAREVSP